MKFVEGAGIYLSMCVATLGADMVCAGNSTHPHIWMVVHQVAYPFLIIFAGAFVGCWFLNACLTENTGNDED